MDDKKTPGQPQHDEQGAAEDDSRIEDLELTDPDQQQGITGGDPGEGGGPHLQF